MPAFAIPAHENGMALEIQGLVFTNPDSPYYYIDAVALMTFGFVYAVTSVWVVTDNIQQVVWVPCDCNYYCDI